MWRTFKNMFSRRKAATKTSQGERRRRGSTLVPRVELLEDRVVPAFLLRFEQDGFAPLTIADNGAGDSDSASGRILFMGPYGEFSINITAVQSRIDPLAGTGPTAEIDLANNNFSTTGPGGTLKITAADTDFNAPPASANPLTFTSQIGGIMSLGAPTNFVSFQSWASADNLSPLPGGPPTVIPAGSVTPGLHGPFVGLGAYSGELQTTFNRGAGPFSMFVQATVSISGSGNAGFNGIARIFGNQVVPANIGDLVWHDSNANGIQDSGEAGVAGATVELFTSGNVLVGTQTTPASGLYLFTGLTPGDYYVKVTPPAGYFFSPKDQGADNSKDSDANTSTGVMDTTTLSSGETDLTWDAGLYRLATIGDFVWRDANSNGIQDSGEPGVAGATVKLFTSGNVQVGASQTTGANGLYLFTGLTPGDYYVEVTKPAGYFFSPKDVGSNDAIDSDADTTTGKMAVTTLVSGEDDRTWDAGLILITPGIDIEKTTNGPSNSNPTAPDYDNEDAANGPGVPLLIPGTTVTWTYKVTNTGNVAFTTAEVVVKDDNGTPSNTSDDFSPTRDLSTDVGADGILSPGEVWLYTASGVVKNLSSPGASSTFTMTGSSALNGPDGNIRTYTAGGISVNASAFSRDKSNGAWSAAWLGSYGGGLGVTDSSEGDGSNNTHTVDNVGRDNYVLFEFSQSVVVDLAVLGYVVNDSDLTVWIGTLSDPFNNHNTLSDALLAGLGFTEVNLTDLTTPRTADLNAGGVSGNVLVIAAWTADASPEDRFKIEKVTVRQPQPGVYENKATVTVPGDDDSDLSHYKNPTTGSISGTKYRDVSGNGLNLSAGPNSPADTPLAGTTIFLDLDNDGVKDAGEPSQVTNASGNYSFTGLTPGTYRVREIVPTGFIRTHPVLADYHTVTVSAGLNSGGHNFANFEKCEPGTLFNVTFRLVHTDGTSEVVTSLNGQTQEGDVITVTFSVAGSHPEVATLVSYTAPEPFFNANTASQQQIYDLAGGTFAPGGPYTLTVSIPNCYYQVDFVCGPVINQLGPAGSNIFYTPQQRLISADNGGTHACISNAGGISGVKYNDLDNDGVRDAGEAGLGSWVIYVDANNNGVKDAGEYATVTKPDGSYKISNQAAGTYTGKLREVNQSGWTQTQGPGTLVLAAGENKTGVNFGNHFSATGTVSGYKFNDKNADGEWDGNGLDNCWGTADDEVGLSGWTLFVDYDKDGTRDANEPYAVSDANGYYRISGVSAGLHEVAEVMQSGWIRTTEDRVVNLTSGGAATNVHFGNFRGSVVMTGDTATVGFWKGANGQALIKKLNGGGTAGAATVLGNWLASNFGNMYGAGCGVNNLAGKTNAQIASYFCTLANDVNKQLEAQVLATVLAAYVTDWDWAGGTYAAAYGFTVTAYGVKNDYYNIGSNGAAFGVVNDTALTVWDILQRTNARASNGILWYGYSSTIRNMARLVFAGINGAGDIGP